MPSVYVRQLLRSREFGPKLLTWQRKTHFKLHEIHILVEMFYNMTGTSGEMSKRALRTFLFYQFDLDDKLLLDRVSKVINKIPDSRVSLDEFICGMSVILRGTNAEKISFCFEAFDINSDGFITKADIIPLAKNAIIRPSTEEDPEDFQRDMIDMMIKKLDVDGDYKICQEDFRLAVKREPELMQCLGIILPDIKKVNSFERSYLQKKEPDPA